MGKKKDDVTFVKNELSLKVDEYESPVEDIEEKSFQLLGDMENINKKMEEFYPKLLEGDLSEAANNVADSLKRTSANISKASKMANVMQDELRSRAKDIKTQRRNRHKLIKTPSNSKIDYREQQSNSFAQGVNLYKILLICFIGSFVGVVIEVIWCFIRHGYIESRAGLVYGPFNLLYGFGAVVLTVTLYRFRNRGVWLSFLGGMIVGSGVEYLCSVIQEWLFGSRSWDYSNVPFNINGRICLLYSIFWGALGVLWIKRLYPMIAQLILRIPDKVGKIITWGFSVFFIINVAMSCISVGRWNARVHGVPPSNAFWEKIDERFPDERMEKVYANLEFGDV